MVLTRRDLLAGATASMTGGGALRAQDAPRLSLTAAAARSRRRFGAAVRPEHLAAERPFREAVLRDCGSITPEIHLKWDALEPTRGERRHGPADELTAFAGRNALALRGHALIWERSTPAWALSAMAREGWPVVAGHFEQTLGRYGAACGVWDVVNEPIDVRAPGGLHRTAFLDAFGPGYIARALHAAHALAPAARLSINDYGFDYENEEEQARRKALLGLVSSLKREGAPLHVVGLQAHLDLSKGPLKPAPLARFLAQLADLGVEIEITELDVKESRLTAPIEARDAAVAAETRRYLEVALDQPAVVSVTTWGLTDRHSWLPALGGRMQGGEAVATTPEGYNRGLPYDALWRPKPMYQALHQSLAASPLARA